MKDALGVSNKPNSAVSEVGESVSRAADSIDNSNNTIIDNNDRYAFKKGFSPRTEETQTAREIAQGLNDLKNYALHRSIVKRLGSQRAYQLYRETLDDMKQGETSGSPIRNPAALFNWKSRNCDR